MKRALFIILVTFLLVLILIYFYDKREIVLNKKYYSNMVQVEYPYFNNELIDDYILNYLNNYISNDNHLLFIDYDYMANDNDVDLTIYVYEEWDGIAREVENNFQIDLIEGSIVPVRESSIIDNKTFKIQAGNGKKVALTFDDGPNYQTNRVLSILEKYKVKATFFVLGCNIHGNEKTIKRMDDLGMEIGNHMYSHKLLSRLSKDEIVLEYRKVDDLVFDIIGKYPTLVRPSYGTCNSKIRSAVDRPIVLWSIDTLDWKYHNSRRIYKKVANTVREGDIILMHDIYRATSNSLELIIPKLLSDGYQFVTISEMFSDVSMGVGKVYSKGN